MNDAKLRNAIVNLKRRISKNNTTRNQDINRPSTDYLNRKSQNFDTKTLGRFDNYISIWNLKAKNFNRKTKRPNSQESLLCKSEKFAEKQTMMGNNFKKYKDLNTMLLEWQAGLRNSSPSSK